MHLKELSRESGVSAASIKYYLREGLLQPGLTRHATLAEYGDEHLLRLRLIHALRNVVGLSVGRIRTLTALIDDPEVEFVNLLGKTQSLVLGYDFKETREHPLTTDVVHSRGWPDVDTDARQALNTHLQEMESLGLVPRPDLLESYAAAVDTVAQRDLSSITDTGNRDQAVLTVAVGVHQYSTLLVRMLALAQTSASLRRYGAGGDYPSSPRT